MLTSSERVEIVKLIELKKFTLEISKILKRDHQTVKHFVNEGKILLMRERKKHISYRPRMTRSKDLRKIKINLSVNFYSTSKKIFDKAGVTKISKRTRNPILKNMVDQKPPVKCPPFE